MSPRLLTMYDATLVGGRAETACQLLACAPHSPEAGGMLHRGDVYCPKMSSLAIIVGASLGGTPQDPDGIVDRRLSDLLGHVPKLDNLG